jgi:hypothetical protein
MDHCADVVFSEPGRCWRMVQLPGVGAPDFCSEPVAAALKVDPKGLSGKHRREAKPPAKKPKAR